MAAYDQKLIVRDFMNAVNREAAKSGSNARIDQGMAKQILDNYTPGEDTLHILGEINRSVQMGEHNGTLNQRSLESLNKNVIKSNDKVCSAIERESRNEAIDISESITNHLSNYNAAGAEAEAYALQAAEERLYGYLPKSDIAKYETLRSGAQKAIGTIQNRNLKNTTGVTLNPDFPNYANSFKWAGSGFT